jgi:hypothetical protein
MKKEENNAKIHPSDSIEGEIEMEDLDPMELNDDDLDNTKNDSIDNMGTKKNDANIIKDGEEEDE